MRSTVKNTQICMSTLLKNADKTHFTPDNTSTSDTKVFGLSFTENYNFNSNSSGKDKENEIKNV